MDFKKFVGKTIVWSGEFKDEEGYTNQYVLFDDKTGVVLPDPDRVDEPRILDDAVEVLTEEAATNIEQAQNVIKLKKLLDGWGPTPQTDEGEQTEEAGDEPNT